MTTASPAAAPLLLRDLRDPSQPMAAFSVRLPVALIDSITRAATANQTSRATLARELLARGLEQLEATADN
jgi:hypothetical protein